MDDGMTLLIACSRAVAHGVPVGVFPINQCP